MKCTSIVYQSREQLQQHVAAEAFRGKHLLIFLFTNTVSGACTSMEEEMEQARRIQREILELLPEATLMGCSTAGAIENGEVLDKEAVITFCQFEHIRPRGACYSLEEYTPAAMAATMKQEILSGEPKLLFLLTDGLKMKAQKLLDEIALQAPHLPLAGGKAGDGYRFERTFVYYNGEVLPKGAVGVALHGPHLRVRQFHRLNWKKIGKKMTVTEAQDNSITTIDHYPVKEIYRRYLGPELAENLPHSAGGVFPLILDRDGVDVARVVSGQGEDGTIRYFGDILSGEEAHFGYGNLSLVFESLESEYRKNATFPAEGIFVFSCIVRKSMLQEKARDELLPFAKLAPLGGFFTYGEFVHFRERNHLLNATMAVTMLSESQEGFREPPGTFPDESSHEDPHLSIINALTHLMDTVTGELEKTNRELEEKNRLLHKLAKIDGLTKLYNHSYLHEVLAREIESALRHRRRLSVAMIDVDDFKEVNDTWGHGMGDRVLIALGECILRNCRGTDIVGRCGGDEFAVIFPETALEEAVKVAERLRRSVEGMLFEQQKVRLTLSIGVAQLGYSRAENLMLDADRRLYRAKALGKNRVVATDEPDASSEEY